jgi:hypothetical protein
MCNKLSMNTKIKQSDSPIIKLPADVLPVDIRDFEELYVADNHAGNYFTLRETPAAAGNNAWINTKHLTIDFKKEIGRGVNHNILNKINYATDSTMALPQGVEFVELNGPTQHNSGRGYSYGLKGFTSVDQIMRYMRRYFYLHPHKDATNQDYSSPVYLTGLTQLDSE